MTTIVFSGKKGTPAVKGPASQPAVPCGWCWAWGCAGWWCGARACGGSRGGGPEGPRGGGPGWPSRCANSEVAIVFYVAPKDWCQISLSAPKAPLATPDWIVFAAS